MAANAGQLGGLTPSAFAQLNSSPTFTGTIVAAGFSGNAAGLTNLDATRLSGTLTDARLSTNVALLNANQAFTGSNRFTGIVAFTNAASSFNGSFSGNGAALSNVVPADGSVTAAKIATGAVTSASLASNLAISGTFSAASFQGNGAIPWQSIADTTLNATANTGYLLTNAVQTAVSLPASANVGDLVQITGVGTGGWQVAGAIVGVTPGLSWTPCATSRVWSSVASSTDGTKLVAAEGPGRIYTSTDAGTNWTARASSLAWIDVASSADGTKLVAVVQNGQIYTSTDSGTNWTPRASSLYWENVASSADGTKLVAIVFNGQIYTSTDSGTNWTARASSLAWSDVASSADGTKLVATVANGQIYTSTDSGTNWTPRASNKGWNAVASSSDGTKLVATTLAGLIYTSTDSGTNWTARASNQEWQTIASSTDGSMLVAAVWNGQIYTSADSGKNWTARESSRSWQAVASSADGMKLVAVENGGLIYTSVPMIAGTTGSTVMFQYIGGGQWQPLYESQVAAGAVGSSQLAAGSVTAASIASNAVTSAQLASGAVTANALAAGAVTTASIASNAITAAKSASGAVTANALAAGAVTANALAAGAVGSSQLASNLTVSGSLTANIFSGNGVSLTNVNADLLDSQQGAFYQNAANMNAGTLADTRLSTNVALLNDHQVFTGTNRFTGVVTSTNAANLLGGSFSGSGTGTFTGTFTGNGGALTNLPSANDYVFAYSTVTQMVTATGSFQDITNNTNGQIDGWTHAANTATFTCNQTGLYLIQYKGQVAFREANADETVCIHALIGVAEIAGSDSAVYGNKKATAAADELVIPVTASFITSINSGEVLKFQIAGTAGTALVPNTGYSSIRPSFSCTITRLK